MIWIQEGWQHYHLHVPIVLKSGSLNLLEPSRPVQACNGIALPLLSNDRAVMRLAHNKWNIKLNTCICLYFMYITCKNSTANPKLTDNLIVSPDTSTLVYGQACWVTWLQYQEATGFKQRLISCVLSMTEWSVSNVAIRILIRTHKFRTDNKTLPPLRIFVSRYPWHIFAEPCLRNNEWDENQTSFSILDEPGTK